MNHPLFDRLHSENRSSLQTTQRIISWLVKTVGGGSHLSCCLQRVEMGAYSATGAASLPAMSALSPQPQGASVSPGFVPLALNAPSADILAYSWFFYRVL